MKALTIVSLALSLSCSGMLAAQDIAVSGPTDEEVRQTAKEFAGRVIQTLEQLANTLALIKDKTTAEAHAATIDEQMERFMKLEEESDNLAHEFKDKEDVVRAEGDKLKDKFEMIISKIRKDGSRIASAKFYGCPALEQAMKKDSIILRYHAEMPEEEKK